MEEFHSLIAKAVQEGRLQSSSAENIFSLLNQSAAEPCVQASVRELVEEAHWTELNDRFYKTLTFGTGGLRGRTIGKIITQAEQGAGSPQGRPQHPAIGTNAMNDWNVRRAAQGLVNYLLKQFPNEPPKIVVAHDTRHFSRQFAELTANVAAQTGGTAYLFEAERSTPELSFAVRHLKAHAGVVITASHNPPHDNGFKVYFQDGGQVVEPHASAIIKEAQAAQATQPAARQGGKVVAIGEDIDRVYMEALKNLVLEPDVIRQQAQKLKIVYTPLHGTGGRIIPRLLEHFGFQLSLQKKQAVPDGRFPTVKSPNPENAEALSLGVEQAKQENADLVFGTDPDADRMGVAVKDRNGEFEMLTGNQIGSVLAAYRLERMFAQGILNRANAARAAIIKTFVTTDLQKTIAKSYGVKCVETLTGFKYIGEKLKDYELAAGGREEGMTAEAWRKRRLERGTFFVFGGEESYGYTGSDDARDKDANAAVLMCAEAAAYAALQGMTLVDYLDALYLKHGFYWEKLGALTFEGAEGAAKIKKLLQSYQANPPTAWDGRRVNSVQDFSREKFADVDGKIIPSEMMLLFHLDEGFRIAVRGSGTEPKIKFYFFGRAEVKDSAALAETKDFLRRALDELWTFTQNDVQARIK
ncbi:MAG: phospho-sugar mutase [bacterium]